jgi:hypothetical protein
MNKKTKIIITKNATGILKATTRINKEAFNITRGLRAATIAIIPIIIGFAINQPTLSIATLGTTFIAYTEAHTKNLHWKFLLMACLTQSCAFGLGILSGAAGTFLSPLLLALAVSIILIGRVSPKWNTLSTYSAITFAVGLGVTGYSGDVIKAVLFLSLIALFGGLLGLFGIGLQRFIMHDSCKTEKTAVSSLQRPMSYSEAIQNAVAVGVACAIGFSIAIVLGLPRDFWVVITILAVMQVNLKKTIAITSMRLIGTLAGGLVAAVVVIAINNLLLQLVVLFFFAVLMFATRGVNYALVQVFLVPYVIILLNLAYPSALNFVFYRVLDVAVGCVIGLTMAVLISITANVHKKHKCLKVDRRGFEPLLGSRFCLRR